MGLNLNINRIIFSTCTKMKSKKQIDASLLKQIAGRAGRSTRDGYVTAFTERDLNYIRNTMGGMISKGDTPTNFEEAPAKLSDSYVFSENEKLIKKACLFPKISEVLAIANQLRKELDSFDPDQNKNKITLYEVFMQFELHSSSDNNLYFIKDLKKALKTSHILRDIDSSLEDQYNFVVAPCKTKEYCLHYLKRFFMEFKNGEGIVKIPQEFFVEKHKYIGKHTSLDDILQLQDKHNCNFYCNNSYSI